MMHWPMHAPRRITQMFGENPNHPQYGYGPAGHLGVDLVADDWTIYAPMSGTVRTLKDTGYGNWVLITGIDGWTTRLAHMSKFLIPDHSEVEAGQAVGVMGATGNAFGAHLHWEVLQNGKRLDPLSVVVEGHMLTTLHVQRPAPWQNDFVRDVRAGWVKIVNPSPGADPYPDAPRILGRIWTDDIDGRYISQGRAGGAAFVRDMLPRWREVPWVVAWELGNEPDANSNTGLANLREYTLGAIEEANRRGLKLCILNLAEGNPHDNGASREGKSDAECRAIERWKWEQLAECVKAAVAGGHFVGLHAYWRPTIEGPTGRYHALGRRKWDIEQLMSMGVPASMKVLINECGIDGGIAGGPAKKGWRTLSNADAYRAEIVEAERYARTVPQIQALMYFTAGPEADWVDFEMDEGFTRSCIGPLQALGSTLPITPIQEVPVTDNPQVKDARWHAEEAVRGMEATIAQLEATIATLKAARERLVTETIPRLYEVE
jgi:hypothetical protein